MDIKLYFFISALVFVLLPAISVSRMFRCPNSRWRLKDFFCDGDNDCGDNWDESNCGPTCPRQEFQCQNGRRIEQRWVCDGDGDCLDGSDESNCSSICQFPGFRCTNDTCVPKSSICDGNNDCEDGSDEALCGIICPALTFTCNNGQIIKLLMVCNRVLECKDYSDEINCKNSILTTDEDHRSSIQIKVDMDSSNSTLPSCDSSYCSNGGSCEIADFNRICRCPDGFGGERCQIQADYQTDNVSDWVIIISILVVALVSAIIIISLYLFSKRIKHTHSRTKGFAVTFHQPQNNRKNKKLSNTEDCDVLSMEENLTEAM